MSKKNKIEMLEETLDRKLTVAEMYANRPRKWLLYTAIVLIIAVLIGWSANDIHFTGLTATGTEVAKGVVHGVFHPDTALMFGSGDSDVPYLLLQTIAIAVLGTLFGAILAIPFAFLASFNIMPKPVAYVVRVLILMIRTIPSIVWALMWIRVTGPGAACGVITQSICSIGMISKMYITAIEDLDTHILESLDAMGCTPLSPSSPQALSPPPSTASISTSRTLLPSVSSARAASVRRWCSASTAAAGQWSAPSYGVSWCWCSLSSLSPPASAESSPTAHKTNIPAHGAGILLRKDHHAA